MSLEQKTLDILKKTCPNFKNYDLAEEINKGVASSEVIGNGIIPRLWINALSEIFTVDPIDWTNGWLKGTTKIGKGTGATMEGYVSMDALDIRDYLKSGDIIKDASNEFWVLLSIEENGSETVFSRILDNITKSFDNSGNVL